MHCVEFDVSDTTAPAPIPSATVMILRGGDKGVEVLLGRRRRGKAFGELHVFPGGLVDPQDETMAALGTSLSEADACRRLGVAAGALRYWIGAVREVFEETGLLFLSSPTLPTDQLGQLRQILTCGKSSFAQLCIDRDLRLDLCGLHYVAHWITPEVRASRFDTRFFVAALPEGQQAVHDGVELTHSVWLTPVEALAKMRAGELRLAPPTLAELQRLSQFDNVAAALAWASECWQASIP